MLAVLPAAGPAPVVRMISAAQRTVDLNVYELTSRKVEHALVIDGERGVRVRVILDAAPYRGARIERREMAWCRSNSRALTCHTAPGRFRFDHAKYIVVDGQTSEVGTENFTYSGLNRNREYMLISDVPALTRALERVFDADWDGTRVGAGPRKWLVLSPGAEPAFKTLIARPGRIDVETEEMGYVAPLTHELEARGNAVRIIVPASLSAYDRRTVAELVRAGVQVHYLSHPYLHAKLILTPGLAFIGSENFSRTSLTRNREVGVLLHSQAELSKLSAQFARDWARSGTEP